MTRLATQRLVDASAALGPADRALLSLLINHGLDDETLARMMHASRAAVASRREQLVQRLGASLGLPPEAILAALAELAASADEQAPADEPSPADAVRPASASTPTNGGPPLPAAAGAVAAPQRAGPLSAPRRLLAAALVLLLIAAIVSVVVLSSGTTERAPTGSTNVRTTAPPTGTGVAPAPAAGSSAHRLALASLPGGPTGVTGSATILGPATRPRLAVSVSGLPAPGRGHYELWLYSSIIDSVALGPLRAPGDSVTVALPPADHHYRWLDVSVQPPGSVHHSGESILRTPLPR